MFAYNQTKRLWTTVFPPPTSPNRWSAASVRHARRLCVRHDKVRDAVVVTTSRRMTSSSLPATISRVVCRITQKNYWMDFKKTFWKQKEQAQKEDDFGADADKGALNKIKGISQGLIVKIRHVINHVVVGYP